MITLRLYPIETVVIEVVKGEIHQLWVTARVGGCDLLQAVVKQALSKDVLCPIVS